MSDLISDAYAIDREVSRLMSWGSTQDEDPTERDEDAERAFHAFDSAPEWGIGDDDVPF